MVSDIPICSFLSGGLDSSLVTAICQMYLKKEDAALDTFSFDFKGNDVNFQANSFQSSQDQPFAELAAKHLGTHHTLLECDNETQADYLFKAVDARDFPCMADVESSMLYFCEQVSRTHRVALTGECADEIFGGYPWFHREELWQKNMFPWSYDFDTRKVLLHDDFSASLKMEEYAKEAYETTLACTPRLAEDSEKEARRREISWLNIRWFMMTLLNLHGPNQYVLRSGSPRAICRSPHFAIRLQRPLGDEMPQRPDKEPFDRRRNGTSSHCRIEPKKESLPENL